MQVSAPTGVQTYFNSNSEPFKFNLESIEEVSIGDFYFIDPEELDQGSIPLTRPLLCKVMEIDTDLEIFTAEWWTMVSQNNASNLKSIILCVLERYGGWKNVVRIRVEKE